MIGHFLFLMRSKTKGMDPEEQFPRLAAKEGQPYVSKDDKKKFHYFLAQKMIDHLKNLVPEDHNNAMKDRISQLETENARLKLSQEPVLSAPPSKKARHEDFVAVSKPEGKPALLEQSAPLSVKAKDMKDWVKTLKFSEKDRKKVESHIKELQGLYKNLEAQDKLNLVESMVVEWGLPIVQAATWDKMGLISIMAFAHAASQ